MFDDILLRVLLEAEGDENDAGREDANADAGTDNTDAADNGQETGNEENATEEENQNNQEDETSDDTENQDEDDFSLDPDGGEEDDGPPPDGLVDPDDDGEADIGSDDKEVNIQTNILQLSKIDRLMAKRKLFADFKELRINITTYRNLLTDNEANVDPDVRELSYDKLDRLYTIITDYLTFKFSYINYEENLQTYLLFAKTLEDIIAIARDDDKTKEVKKNKDKPGIPRKTPKPKKKPKKHKKEEEQEDTEQSDGELNDEELDNEIEEEEAESEENAEELPEEEEEPEEAEENEEEPEEEENEETEEEEEKPKRGRKKKNEEEEENTEEENEKEEE